MSEEKKMILSMLEKGIITSDEAMELINAIDDPDTEEKIKFNDNYDSISINLEEKLNKIGAKINEETDDISVKMNNLGSKISRKATSFAERIMDKIDKAMDSGMFENHMKNHTKYEETIEESISDITRLKINTKNGRIVLNKSDDENMKIKVVYYIKNKVASNTGQVYKTQKSKNAFEFDQTYFDNIMLNLEILLPEKKYEQVFLYGSNGSIKAYNLKADSLLLDTKNGKIILDNASSSKIDLRTTNASIDLCDIISEDILLDTKNGKIVVENVNTKDLISTTSNATVSIKNSVIKNINTNTKNAMINIENMKNDYLNQVHLSTSNAPIVVKLNNTSKEMSFDLNTTNDSININVPNVLYKLNSKGKVLAYTQNFTQDSNSIKISASTKNGQISINY